MKLRLKAPLSPAVGSPTSSPLNVTSTASDGRKPTPFAVTLEPDWPLDCDKLRPGLGAGASGCAEVASGANNSAMRTSDPMMGGLIRMRISYVLAGAHGLPRTAPRTPLNEN